MNRNKYTTGWKECGAHNLRYLNSKKFDYKNRKRPTAGNPKPGTGNRVWARGDLNSGPFDYQSNAPTWLSYGPLKVNKLKVWIWNNFKKEFLRMFFKEWSVLFIHG